MSKKDNEMLLNMDHDLDSDDDIEEFKLPPSRNRKKPKRRPLDARIQHGTSVSLFSLKCFGMFFLITVVITGCLLLGFFLLNTQNQINELKTSLETALQKLSQVNVHESNAANINTNFQRLTSSMKKIQAAEANLEGKLNDLNGKDSTHKESAYVTHQLQLLSNDISSLKDGMAHTGSVFSELQDTVSKNQQSVDRLNVEIDTLKKQNNILDKLVKEKTEKSIPAVTKETETVDYVTTSMLKQTLALYEESIMRKVKAMTQNVSIMGKTSPSNKPTTSQLLQHSQLETTFNKMFSEHAASTKNESQKFAKQYIQNILSAVKNQVNLLNATMIKKFAPFENQLVLHLNAVKSQQNMINHRISQFENQLGKLDNKTTLHLSKFSEEFYPDLVGVLMLKSSFEQRLHENAAQLKLLKKQLRNTTNATTSDFATKTDPKISSAKFVYELSIVKSAIDSINSKIVKKSQEVSTVKNAMDSINSTMMIKLHELVDLKNTMDSINASLVKKINLHESFIGQLNNKINDHLEKFSDGFSTNSVGATELQTSLQVRLQQNTQKLKILIFNLDALKKKYEELTSGGNVVNNVSTIISSTPSSQAASPKLQLDAPTNNVSLANSSISYENLTVNQSSQDSATNQSQGDVLKKVNSNKVLSNNHSMPAGNKRILPPVAPDESGQHLPTDPFPNKSQSNANLEEASFADAQKIAAGFSDTSSPEEKRRLWMEKRKLTKQRN